MRTVGLEPDDIELLAAFYRRVWDSGATPETVARARNDAARTNAVDPGEPPPTFLLVSGGEAIGHVTTIPVRVRTGDRERGVYWIKGLMVLPEYRNGAVAYLVLREAVRHVECSMAMVVQPQVRKLFGALGFTTAGVLGNFIKPLRSFAVVRKVDVDRLGLDRVPRWLRAGANLASRPRLAPAAGACLDAGLRLVAATAGRTGRCDRIDVGGLDDPALQRLCAGLRRGIDTGVVRDGRYLVGRYGPAWGERYVLAGVGRGEAATGVGVVRRPREDADPRLGGIRIATLSEVLCDPNRRADLLATIAASERAAARVGAEAVVSGASDRRLAAALLRRGFFRMPGNVHFLTRFPDPDFSPPAEIGRWWLTRGDSGADEVF